VAINGFDYLRLRRLRIDADQVFRCTAAWGGAMV